MKENIRKKLPSLIIVILITWVFSSWLYSPVILGGDFNFINYEHFRLYSSRPYIWDFSLNNGFGQTVLFTLPFFYYAFIANTLTIYIANPFLLHKIIFLFPALIITVISITVLSRQQIKNSWGRAVAILLYCINPYFLMLISGGQLGVAFAYGFSPLVIATYFKVLQIQKNNLRWSIQIKWMLTAALTTAILISFDSRLALLIVLLISGAYLGTWLKFTQKEKLTRSYFIQLILTTLIIVGYHAYWIIPSIFVQSVALPTGYASVQSVEFFSFGRFAHAITWTHPNYPDNLFGVVKEIGGVALLLPILAFWLVKKTTKLTLYLSIVALVSAFLAKGANEPFGQIYVWAFQHIPMFSWFRDSTKFFLPLSIAYSLLIGMTTKELIESTLSNKVKAILISLVIICIGYIWAPTFTHSIGGTLAYRTYPQEFQEIEKTLKADKSFGRVLWIPSREMYGYYDTNHPAVSLNELRNYPECIPSLCQKTTAPLPNKKEFTKEDLHNQIADQISFLDDPYSEDIFQKLAINYVIVSPDVDHTLYMYDRKFDPDIKLQYQQKISQVGWLQPAGNVYHTNKKGVLLTQSNDFSEMNTVYSMMNPINYSVSLQNIPFPLKFSQRFDPHWQLIQGNNKVTSTQDQNGLIEFPTSDLKSGSAIVQFSGQGYADIGLGISITIIALTITGIVYINRKVRSS